MNRKKRGPAPPPSRKEVPHWMDRAFASTTDDAIRDTCRSAYFPNGLKLSPLEDVEENCPFDPESASDSGSERRQTWTATHHHTAVFLMTQTHLLGRGRPGMGPTVAHVGPV